jgi:hypothetical protein
VSVVIGGFTLMAKIYRVEDGIEAGLGKFEESWFVEEGEDRRFLITKPCIIRNTVDDLCALSPYPKHSFP